MQDVRGAERDRDDRERRDRVQAAGREVRAPKRLHREPADRRADDDADPELLHEQQAHVEHAVVADAGSTR